MKKIITNVLFLLFFFISIKLNAQETDFIIPEEDYKIQKNAILVYLGPGVGVGYARELNNSFSFRTKVSFFKWDLNRDNLSLNGRKVDLIGKLRYNTLDFLFDYRPFQSSSFKLVTGISYLSSAKFNAVLTPAKVAGDYKYGDITISKENLGNISAGGDWSGIAPYVGIGFGRAIPRDNLGFGFDLGGYFTGKPTSYFNASGSLTPTATAEREDFIQWMNRYRVIPNFTIHVNYKF